MVKSDQRVEDRSEPKTTDRDSIRHDRRRMACALAEGDRVASEAETEEGRDVVEWAVDRHSQQTGRTSRRALLLSRRKLGDLSE